MKRQRVIYELLKIEAHLKSYISKTRDKKYINAWDVKEYPYYICHKFYDSLHLKKFPEAGLRALSALVNSKHENFDGAKFHLIDTRRGRKPTGPFLYHTSGNREVVPNVYNDAKLAHIRQTIKDLQNKPYKR